jgi:hypothetical protein
MSSISYPLNSNTLANPTTALYSGGGGGGVQAVAAGAGITVAGTSTVTVTNANLAAGANGAIQLSNGSGILKNVTGVSAADNGTLSAVALNTGAVQSSSIQNSGTMSSAGILTLAENTTFAATGTAVSGTWKQTTTRVAGMEKKTWTLLNSPFSATTVLNIPIVPVASKIKVFCVNNGNTQSRSIQAQYSLSFASGVYTQGAAYEQSFNMVPTWSGSGSASPTYTVALAGGGGGLVGTISCIIEQETIIS